jgi:Flp pilus assembly protein TadD
MSELDTRIVHYLNSAMGWLELGNPREARAEMDRLPAEFADDLDVLDIRWSLHAREEDWEGALKIAERLVAIAPNEATGWLHRAYAVRRVANGGLEKATEILRRAFEMFPGEATIPFNLACYDCQLGNLRAAGEWLKQALARGERAFLKTMALSDTDLEPLWPEIRKW